MDAPEGIITPIDVRRLPAAPHVVLHLLRVCNEPDVSFETLSELVRKDPALVAKVLSNVNGSPFAEISISDNGPGIPDEILPNLFSPVASSKGDSHSGLGLTIVKELVEELQGSISCRSGEKEGGILRPAAALGCQRLNGESI